ncbi:NACHT domain-containing protein [Paraburkholderia graminis]|uniref:NACHT domain-containing protein n=1 Tax=Paraburkholderia graminis TaxID=60548 RepID=UPI0038BD0C9C
MQQDDSPDARYYFARHLQYTDGQGQNRSIEEAELVAIAGPKVVLGEPGMGKSELICKLAGRLKVQPVTAVRFMSSRNPAMFVVPGKPVLIDGLDEAMARREGDAIDVVLAQLEHAGSPDVILSCRAREWQARSAINLRHIYETDASIFTLEPLTRAEASTFLVQLYTKADPNHVLNHLEHHGIADLYGNPLTLRLMGQVAEHDAQLPSTRAALFDRVCKLIWPEHDPHRDESGLGRIAEDEALSAAGAIAAGLLLAGADAGSLAGPGRLEDGDIRLADIEGLPGASAARAVFSSKLFHSAGSGRARPIHRVIAEFLGARWLAQQAVTKRTQRRLLAQLQGSGAVPASLRGLHAWLAFHSPVMAKAVIRADPFGVLRYGEVNDLTAEHADIMLNALQALAENDPYFRAQDWGSHTAIGLAAPNLCPKIKAIIASSASNSHLRSLLIEVVKDTPLAGELAGTLEAITLSTERFYSERLDAARSLLPNRDRAWWQCAIADLRTQATEDSIRLATELIQEIDCDVSDELLVAALLADIGVTVCPLPRVHVRPTHTFRHHSHLVESLSTTRLVNVLNILSEHVTLFAKDDAQSAHDLADLSALLISRVVNEQLISLQNAGLLWNWLELVAYAHRPHRGTMETLLESLEAHDELRHAVQYYALYETRFRSSIWQMEVDLAQRLVGLSLRPRDVTRLLGRLAGLDNKDRALREDWKDLMRLGIGRDGLDPEMRAVSERFRGDDQQLGMFVQMLENPKKPAWKRRQERQNEKRAKKRRIAYETQRRYFKANKDGLLAGELVAIVDPAKAYLGLFSDIDRGLQPMERIVAWLGAELANDAMTGFEAVLCRVDLPTPEDVSHGFATGTRWNYCYAIMAGLLARQRTGKGLADLSQTVRMTALLLCLNDRGMCNDDDVSALCEALEKSLIQTAQERANFARIWIEPSLAAGVSHIPGLYKLARDEHWQEVGAPLAREWLLTTETLCERTELELVDCLTLAGELDSLAPIAAGRVNVVYDDLDHMFAWLAIDVLVRFDAVRSDLLGIGAQNPEFIWFLRDRFQLERHGALLRTSVSQAQWIVSEFRAHWPHQILVGSGSGNTNAYDATEFLLAMINRIANDTGAAGDEAMQALLLAPHDSYSELIRHMAAEQRQKRAEEEFVPLAPKELRDLLTEGPPSNSDDLKSLVLEELHVAQQILIGDDVDQVRDFWNDVGVPYDENRCRDRLAAIIGPELVRYNVQRITEADMPKTKRADLAFAYRQLQLPMEVKGQWHAKVWQAASDQLDRNYLIDWRSDGRGIYCVLWFGDLPSKSGRRLQAPPNGFNAPQSADEMRRMLIERIPEARQSLIDVFVLDLTAGKSLLD